MEYRYGNLDKFVKDLIRFERECERDGVKYKLVSFISINHYGIILETWR